MADLSDVETAITSKVIDALYPNGVSQVSVVGVTCRVYRGWPLPATLNSDLAAGAVNVTVFPAATPDEVLDPYFDRPTSDLSSTSLAATVTGQTVTISGSVTESLMVGLLVDGVPTSYRTNAGDNNDSVAANLMALISADRIAILSGSMLTIPGAESLVARIVTNGIVSRGLRRIRREIRIACWCPSPALRDSVCKIVDLALEVSSFINLMDNTSAHVVYASTEMYDQSERALLYRRDLSYKCEYTVISSVAAPVMLFGDLFSNGSGSFV